MMSGPIIVAILAIIVGPLGTYIIANRKLSGKIGTSEAADLWAESSNIRADYRAQIQELNSRIDALVLENADLKRQITELQKGV